VIIFFPHYFRDISSCFFPPPQPPSSLFNVLFIASQPERGRRGLTYLFLPVLNQNFGSIPPPPPGEFGIVHLVTAVENYMNPVVCMTVLFPALAQVLVGYFAGGLLRDDPSPYQIRSAMHFLFRQAKSPTPPPPPNRLGICFIKETLFPDCAGFSGPDWTGLAHHLPFSDPPCLTRILQCAFQPEPISSSTLCVCCIFCFEFTKLPLPRSPASSCRLISLFRRNSLWHFSSLAPAIFS